jgi:hypothetical protein
MAEGMAKAMAEAMAEVTVKATAEVTAEACAMKHKRLMGRAGKPHFPGLNFWSVFGNAALPASGCA